MNYKSEDLVFLDIRTGDIHSKGIIGFHYSGWWYNGEGEPPSFQEILYMDEVIPIMDYLKKQFPKGWKIEKGEIVGL